LDANISKIKMNKQVLHTLDEVRDWFNANDVSKVAFDTETTSLDYYTLEILGLSFCNGGAACYIDLAFNLQKDSILQHIKFHFQESIQFLIAHNLPFDLKVIYKYGITDTTPNVFCTMTAAHLIDENGPKSLEALTNKTTKFEDAFSLGPTSPQFYEYALTDAIETWKLYRTQDIELRRQGLDKLFYEIEMPFQFCLRDLAINGLLIDKDMLNTAIEEVYDLVLDKQVEIYKSLGTAHVDRLNLIGEREVVSNLNLNSPKQISKKLLDLELELTEFGDNEDPSTGKRVLESLRGQHPFIQLMLDYRSLSRLYSGFLKGMPDRINPDGRIRPDFNNCVAVTGRLSSSNPNFQNLPRERKDAPASVRALLVAPKGRKFICADFSGQELRVLAQVSQDPTMIAAFKNNQDLHLTTAKMFFGLDIPDECLVTTHPKYDYYKTKYKEERDRSKTINFGISYGKTPIGFSKDWHISEKEATEVVDGYFKKFPRVQRAIKNCKYFIQQHKYIPNIARRRRRFKKINARAGRQAFNFLIQGASADMCKAAMVRVRELLSVYPEWGGKLVLTVHDEVVIEMNEEYVEDAIPYIQTVMEKAFTLKDVELVVDISWGNNYAEAK
jgi:DNA polymerase-1